MKTKKITGLVFALSLGTVLSNVALADVTTTGTGDTTTSSATTTPTSSDSTASSTSSSNNAAASTTYTNSAGQTTVINANSVTPAPSSAEMAASIQAGTAIDQQQAASDANEYLNAMAPTLQSNATNTLGDYASTAINSNVEADSPASRDSYTPEQWNDANNSWGTSAVQGAGQSSEAGGCDPNVSKGIFNAQLQEIGGAKKLAAQTITPPPSNAFKNLINSGCIPGFGGSVGFPSLSQLASMPGKLAQQLCQAAQSIEQNYLNQYVAEPLNGIAANTNIGLGSIGGYSLGSVPLGVQTSASATTGGKGGVSFNSDAVQTLQSLGTDATNTINSIRGSGGNGGSGGMSSGLVKNALQMGFKALKSKL